MTSAPDTPPEPEQTPERAAGKCSRWGPLATLNIPSTLQASHLSRNELTLHVVQLRIEEIGRTLRAPARSPSPSRSPSPEPHYDTHGKRTNTRLQRTQARLDAERHALVLLATSLSPTYTPPATYRRPTRTTQKIYIPIKEFPEINFIGLLLGPRGTTLKKMETDTGAKIAIRGRGSVKEGKGAPASYQNQEEDLHCQITAESEDKVNKAVTMVNHIIETASTVPEGQNELKRKQLRDLAALNGTLRDDEGQICQNCGGIGHKKWNCPERQNFTNTIICHICGGAGHMSRDCVARRDPEAMREFRERDGKLNEEYASLMAELGAGPEPAGSAPPGSARPWQGTGSGGGGGSGGGSGTDGSGAGTGGAPWQGGSGGGAGINTTSGSSLPPWAAGTASGLGNLDRGGRSRQTGSGYEPPVAAGGPAPWAAHGSAPLSAHGPGMPPAAPPPSSSNGMSTTTQQVPPPAAAGGTGDQSAAYMAYYQYYYQQALAAQQQQQQGGSGDA